VEHVTHKPIKTDPKSFKADLRAKSGTHAEEMDDLDDLDFSDEGMDIEPLRLEGAPPPDAKPNPVELPAPINPEGGRKQSVEMHRNLFCVHYDDCLDEAVKRSWNSFTCVRCAFYHTTEEEAGGVERFATQRKAT
jgi:hypothetical protein